MTGHSKHNGAGGFKIGMVRDQYAPGNHVHSGKHYAPFGSTFEGTGRERKTGPSYRFLVGGMLESNGVSISSATGPRRSALPDRTVRPTGKVYAHTDSRSHNYNLRSLVNTPWQHAPSATSI